VLVGFEDAELAAALDWLLVDGHRRSLLAEAGERRARERFSFEAMVDRWEALLTADIAPTRSP
jgi:glycosyltransferase involved in cell wall biosynthesis